MTTTTTLPASYCAYCGDAVRAGKGDTIGEYRNHRAGLSVVHGWTRRCARCAEMSDEQLVGSLLGEFVKPATVGRISHPITAGRMFPELARRDVISFEPPAGVGKRWGHLTEEDIEAIRDEVRRIEAVGHPHYNLDERGACALCGVQKSTRWTDAPNSVRWSDGTPTAFCSPCTAIWSRRGRPTGGDRHKLRAVALEAATGANWLGMDQSEDAANFRAYFEMPGADGNGNSEAWTYAPQIAEILNEYWTRSPHLAPEHVRPYYEQMRAEADAAETARQREAVEQNAWTLQ